jgi:DNA (cytosine-5)-methyltransferase 1
MNELALFAGAGGGILGGHLLGWRTVCAVEWEAYPASVLCARQNDGLLPPFPIWDDVQTFDGKPWRGIVDVVSGGFPCQDISAAGKGAGIDGERSGMWREMARIIGEVRPKFVFVENSPMLVHRGLGTVLADLSIMGFDAEWGVIGADEIGAHHQRKRQWIVAHSNNSIGGGNAGGSGAHKNAVKNGTYIPSLINPSLYEWLMGWPLGWTDLKPLETDKFHKWLELHGNFLKND